MCTWTYYGNCDELCCDVEDAVIGCNYAVDINGSSSHVIESNFMVYLYTFGRTSHLNSDGTVVPATDYELEAWIATLILYYANMKINARISILFTPIEMI